MIKFSANLGLLFAEYDLPDAIHAAHDAGFDAVECHWPYAHPSDVIKSALDATGLKMLGINTARGDAEKESLAFQPYPTALPMLAPPLIKRLIMPAPLTAPKFM